MKTTHSTTDWTLIANYTHKKDRYRLVLFTQSDDRAEILDKDGNTQMTFTSNLEVLLPDSTQIGRICISQNEMRLESQIESLNGLCMRMQGPEPFFPFEIEIFKAYRRSIEG